MVLFRMDPVTVTLAGGPNSGLSLIFATLNRGNGRLCWLEAILIANWYEDGF